MPIPDETPSTAPAKRKSKARPWRDNIEAITVSIVIIVLFKYFVLEAYKIPTGSMQPTLMGWTNPKGGGVFDRVLVDKFSFHYRDPERFEITVFKYPLDRSKNFIKRIWGLPGEELEIRDGDVWVKRPGESDWNIPRRPEPVLGAVLKRLGNKLTWKASTSSWNVGKNEIRAKGPGSARFPGNAGTVLDRFEHGYPEGMQPLVAKGRGHLAQNDVGDLRFESEVIAQANCTHVLAVFHEGSRRYTVRIPGPAATAGSYPELRIADSSNTIESHEILSQEPFALRAGDSAAVRAENIDNRISLWIDGKQWLAEDIPAIPASQLHRTGITLATEGGGADFAKIEVSRDIFFTATAKVAKWKLPDDGYVVLGDNTQDSADSRDWSLARWELTGGDNAGTVLEGNLRNGENPRVSNNLVFLHDKQGERNVFPQSQARSLSPELASFVPRHLIRGRAVLVVWPLVPSLGVYRLKWVR